MRLLGKRPLCTLCAVAVMAALMGIWMPPMVFFGLLGAALFGTIGIVIAARCGRIGFYSACMACCLLLVIPLGFGVSARYYGGTVKQLESEAGEVHTVEGMIVERKWGFGYSGGFLLRVDMIDGAPKSATLLLACDYPADWQPGHYVRVTAKTEVLKTDINGFDQRSYYLAQGVAVQLTSSSASDVEIVDEDRFSIPVTAARLNSYLAARLRLSLGDETGRLLSAIFLGRRDDLSDTVIRDFKRLGMSHLLALSGLHLSIFTGAVGKLLGALRIGRKGRGVIQLLFVGAYVLLTGAPISVVRAALMLSLTCLSAALWEESDAMTSLFGAAALICLVNPPALMDIGFWMSVLATLGMLLCGQIKFSKLPRLLRYPAKTALSTCVASLLTLPFVWLSSGELSWLSLLTNLIFVPLVSLLLYCALVVLVSGGLFGAPIAAFANVILKAVGRIARTSGITMALQNTDLFWFLLPFLAVCFVILLRPVKCKRLAALVLSVSLLFFGGGAFWISRDPALDVVYTTVGASEVIVLQNREGALICDLGNGAYTPLRSAATYVGELGETEIAVLMLTHYHTKHINAVRQLCGDVLVHRLFLPEPNTEREQEILWDIEEIAATETIEVVVYPDGVPIEFGDTRIYPHTRTMIARSEQPLLLLRIEQGGEALTYVGASVLESPLADRAAEYISDSRYLLLGEHGPKPKAQVALRGTSTVEQIIIPDKCVLDVYIGGEMQSAFLTETPIVVAERIRLRLAVR